MTTNEAMLEILQLQKRIEALLKRVLDNENKSLKDQTRELLNERSEVTSKLGMCLNHGTYLVNGECPFCEQDKTVQCGHCGNVEKAWKEVRMSGPVEHECRACKFFKSHETNDDLCLRYPPDSEGSQRITWSNNWCGEFQESEEHGRKRVAEAVAAVPLGNPPPRVVLKMFFDWCANLPLPKQATYNMHELAAMWLKEKGWDHADSPD